MAENRRVRPEARSQEVSARKYNRNERNGIHAPTGFEGMNFEEPRGPYQGSRNIIIIRNNTSEDKESNRREDFKV